MSKTYIVDTTITITQTIKAESEAEACEQAEYQLDYGRYATTPLFVFLDGVGVESTATEEGQP